MSMQGKIDQLKKRYGIDSVKRKYDIAVEDVEEKKQLDLISEIIEYEDASQRQDRDEYYLRNSYATNKSYVRSYFNSPDPYPQSESKSDKIELNYE